ncbi:MAG: TMEM43 family protein [Akkermansiaceae bacterium]|nr:TMEM43 family protein [Akkermansiaceae bacterium]
MNSSTGWFGRIGNSIKGILFGLVLIVVSVPILFFNEGRAVKTRKSLEEGAKSLVTVSVEQSESVNDGKLIYFTGKAVTEGSLEDPDFKVRAEALKLRRNVEFYQWQEDVETKTKKKLGGGEETVKTYDYTKKWTGKAIDSSKFERPEGHENPSPALNGDQWKANPITVGGFTLSSK